MQLVENIQLFYEQRINLVENIQYLLLKREVASVQSVGVNLNGRRQNESILLLYIPGM